MNLAGLTLNFASKPEEVQGPSPPTSWYGMNHDVNHDVNQHNMLYNVVMHKETMQPVVTVFNTDLIAYKMVQRTTVTGYFLQFA